MQLKIFHDGNQFSITSTVTKKQYDLVAKHKPSALVTKDDKDNEVFAVTYSKGNPFIGPKAVCFSGVNKEDKLVLTGSYPADAKEPKEVIADQVGAALGQLTKFEETIPAVAAAIQAERETLMAGIVEV